MKARKRHFAAIPYWVFCDVCGIEITDVCEHFTNWGLDLCYLDYVTYGTWGKVTIWKQEIGEHEFDEWYEYEQIRQFHVEQ